MPKIVEQAGIFFVREGVLCLYKGGWNHLAADYFDSFSDALAAYVAHFNIKPCPFCGQEVAIRFHGGDYGYTPPSTYIRCDKCDVGFSYPTEKWSRETGHYSIIENAILRVVTKWNTRAT